MPSLRAVFVLLLAVFIAPRAVAQAPLFLADEQTTVRGISFTFSERGTFEEDLLKQHIATREPGFVDRVKRLLPFLSPAVYPLDRIELQRDVVRLRRFYRQNGFLNPWVDYGESQLDTTNNTINVVFEITEGPPLIIQDVNFFAPDGRYATSLFADEMLDRWIRFRDRTSFKTGDRFTQFDLVRIQDQVLSWLKDQGYAFARFDSTSTAIDSMYYTADIGFYINPGPVGYVSEIQVEGNRSVTRQTILRELPFRIGDRFSNTKLIEGQRELFGLNLFRVALADVLPVQEDTTAPLQSGFQWRDSTVTVRFRVREASLRYLTAQTGYANDPGVTLRGQWSHRNFLGEARNLTVNLTANTGYLAANTASGAFSPSLFRAGVALRQPYLLTRRLSAVVEPFIQAERDPLIKTATGFLSTNRRELGVITTFFYEIFPFRTASLKYTLSQALIPEGIAASGTGPLVLPDTSLRDLYSKSILTLNGTFGKVNNFLNPRRGFLVRPFVEQAGTLSGLINAGVTYFKTGAEIVAYLPLTRRTSLGARLTGGRLWPSGESNDQFDLITENRFDPIRFYAGGSNDVRGWDQGLIGPKVVSAEFLLADSMIVIDPKTNLPRTREEQYDAVGGLAKLVGNLELRLPFPGLGSQWRTAVFLDFGQVSAEKAPTPDCDEQKSQCGFSDNGSLSLGNFKFGTGAGIRYETPVGYLRLDIAFKINPDDQDLQSPRDAFLFEQGFLDQPRKDNMKRFNFHLSLGQAF